MVAMTESLLLADLYTHIHTHAHQNTNFIRLNFSNWLKTLFLDSIAQITFHSTIISPFCTYLMVAKTRKMQLNRSTVLNFRTLADRFPSENGILKILLPPHTSLIGFVNVRTVDNVFSTHRVNIQWSVNGNPFFFSL